MLKKILFTDLDGTLLDFHTYSCAAVKESVAKLKAAEVSIIFCSSKTWAEQEFYQKELQLNEPVIIENGSGILFPQDSNLPTHSDKHQINFHRRPAIALGKTYDEVLKALRETTQKYYPELKYYANLSIEEISEITKLDSDAAKKAKSRDFSETVFNATLESAEYLQFNHALKSLGFQCIPGSKYVTISSNNTDKGNTVQLLIDLYKQQYEAVLSYGAGDSQNDRAMLEVVDFPYLVQKPDHTWTQMQLNKLTKINAIGPLGWNIMAKEILCSL